MLLCITGGSYAVLVRRQLSSSHQESSSSLISIDEEAEIPSIPEEDADLIKRTETGENN